MELYIAGLALLVGLLGLLKGDFKSITIKDIILTVLIAIVMIIGGVLSYNDITTKNEEKAKAIAVEKEREIKEKAKIENTKLKCAKALSEACNRIYGTITDYNKNKKQTGKKIAEWVAGINFKINGDELLRTRNDYKEYINPATIDTIDMALKLLTGVPAYIIQDRHRLDYLYSYICAIDKSFLKKTRLYELSKEQYPLAKR